MERFTHVIAAAFSGTALTLPMSLRLSRRAQAEVRHGDNDTFATSVQTVPPVLTAELRLRGTDVAEKLSLGDSGTLSVTVARSNGGATRTITLTGTVLTAVELTYEQGAMATATLRFTAEANDSTTDPFAAEDDA